MDDQRFDSLSRVIARSTTRRATLKGVAAVLGGGIFASVFGMRPQLAGAQGTGLPGDDCETGEDCESGNCSESGICYCVDPTEPWRGCDCNTGTEAPCGGGTLVCCATGSEPGGPGICTSSMEGCNPTGECSAEPGDACEADTDCCTGTCQGGICACSDPDRPWVGCACSTGTENPCGGLVCCATGTTPGGPGTCISPMASCEPPSECSISNEACKTSDDCCGTFVCLDSGVCGTVSSLPNTGAGMTGGGTDLGTLAGLAAAAGAAAIAARKLSPKASPASDEA